MNRYTIVKKYKPRGVDHILFNFKNDVKTGVIDFVDLKKLGLIDDVNRSIIPEESISINFPIFDHYFVVTLKSKNGWTFKKLIMYIYKVGLMTANYLYKYQPTAVAEFAKTPLEYINTFALVSANKRSDITKKGSSIYINLHNSTRGAPPAEPAKEGDTKASE